MLIREQQQQQKKNNAELSWSSGKCKLKLQWNTTPSKV